MNRFQFVSTLIIRFWLVGQSDLRCLQANRRAQIKFLKTFLLQSRRKNQLLEITLRTNVVEIFFHPHDHRNVVTHNGFQPIRELTLESGRSRENRVTRFECSLSSYLPNQKTWKPTSAKVLSPNSPDTIDPDHACVPAAPTSTSPSSLVVTEIPNCDLA